MKKILTLAAVALATLAVAAPARAQALRTVKVTPHNNLQAAINKLGRAGGTVVFRPGTYRVSRPLKLPAGNRAMLTLSGYGATVDLTAATPRFLVWNRSSGTVFRHITIAGFRVNAMGRHPSRGSYSPIGFDMQSGPGVYGADAISIENLTLKDITATNIATSPTSAWNPCDINIMTQGSGRHITGVLVKNCHLKGGSRGVSVLAQGSRSSVTINKIAITGCRHDTGINPSSFSASTNYQVGQYGHLGTLTMSKDYGARAFDCGIEIDNAASATLTGCVEENCYYNEYYDTNFATPLSGAGTGTTTLRNCTARVTRSVHGGTGFGIGWEGVPIGTIRLDNFAAHLAYGTKNAWWIDSSAVRMKALLINGVRAH